MSEVTFTDTITVRVIDSDIAPDNMLRGRAAFEVTAPRSAWLDHGSDGFEITPDPLLPAPQFFRPVTGPAPDSALTDAQQYLLRGALETVAEQSWAAFQALWSSGVPVEVASVVLPGHHMLTQHVTASGLTLSRFVDAHYSRHEVGSEVRIIARGYAAHLAETAPEFLPRN